MRNPGGCVRANGRASRAPAGEDDVTASELAAFSYCAKAWHLERVVGVPPSAGALRAREDGVDHHARHGAQVHVGSWMARHSRLAIGVLLVLATALLAAALRF